MKAEPYPFVGNVVPNEALFEELACSVEQWRVQSSQDDASQGPSLSPSHCRPIWFDDEAAVVVDPKGKAVAPEAMDRDSDVDMPQEGL